MSYLHGELHGSHDKCGTIEDHQADVDSMLCCLAVLRVEVVTEEQRSEEGQMKLPKRHLFVQREGKEFELHLQ